MTRQTTACIASLIAFTGVISVFQSDFGVTGEPKARVGNNTPDGLPSTTDSVVLGSPELTAGLSGEGPLSIDEINEWLNNPRNHLPLELRLPLGLSNHQHRLKMPKLGITRAKIELGRQLFFDPRLSADGSVSCANCHDPQHGYTVSTRFAPGVGGKMGRRNPPVIFNRILYGHIGQDEFWDGRATCIEDAVLFAVTNPIEMANSLDQLTTTLRSIDGYEVQFRRIYGKVTTAAVADSVASFVRVLVTGPSAYDYHQAFEPYRNDSPEYLKEEPELRRRHDETKAAMVAHPMSESALRGAWVYFGNKAQCSACHWSMTMSDNRFHNIGIGMAGDSPDLGRFLVTGDEKDRGAFKTPPVRNVTQTAPYMHDGSIATLEGIVDWYAQGGHANPQLSHRFEKIELTDQDKDDLVEFMRALTGPLPHVRTDRLPE